jgi:tetratricopeptide (TPR) repeat protein
MRIVMIGNCQIQAMLGLYTRFAEKSFGQDILYVRSYETISAEHHRALETADVIVEQLQDFRPKGDIAGITVKAERIAVPVVHGGFLWPFAGQPHPNNPSPSFREAGPYGSEMSDAYLNRLVKANTPPDEAVRKYSALDVNATVSLDRLLEISLEKQRSRDSASGFSIAPVIEAYFRREPIFLTPYHPNARVAVALAEQLFAKLGVDPGDTRRMQRTMRVTPFPKDELPVHPAVARHFGLSWATPDRRYRFLDEGAFTFAEFASRYAGCVWNEALDAGIAAARARDFAGAIALLTGALADSPGSAAGHSVLGTALEHVGRWEEAIAPVEAAVRLNHTEAAYRLQLGLLLYRQGKVDAAERELRVAAALDPFWPHYTGMLGHRLTRDGAAEEAAAVLRHGLVHAPYSAQLHTELGHALAKLGDAAGAAASFEYAATFETGNAGPLIELSKLREHDGDLEGAVALMRRALQVRPDDINARMRLATLLQHLDPAEAGAVWAELLGAPCETVEFAWDLMHGLQRAGRLADAEAVGRRAMEAFPGAASFRLHVASILEGRGDVELAAEEVERAREIAPQDAEAAARHGHLMIRLGQLERAEQPLRDSIALGRHDAHIYGQLGHVLGELKRHEEAIGLRERAAMLEPTNPFRKLQLAHALVAAGRLEGAEREFRLAIAVAPDVAVCHIDLSHALARAGRLKEAIEAARRGVSLEPGTARFMLHYGQLLDEAKLWDEAETAYRAVLNITPSDAHTHVQLSRLAVRRERFAEARLLADAAVRLAPDNPHVAHFVRTLPQAAAA